MQGYSISEEARHHLLLMKIRNYTVMFLSLVFSYIIMNKVARQILGKVGVLITFLVILAIRVWLSQLFVTLHLPLPVIIIFLAGRRFFSITVTEFLSAAVIAAISPAAPPPIITVFFKLRPSINLFLYFKAIASGH